MNKEPTKEQENIISDPGNIVVTANPGSGKTFTIVEKIATLLSTMPESKGVIAISYTNKASDELKSRCVHKGVEQKQSFFGTMDRFYITQIIMQFACHITHCNPEYEVLDNIEYDKKYERLKLIGDKLSEFEENLLISSLAEGKIFLDILGYTAWFLLNKVPGVITYIKAKYTHIFIDEYQDCGYIQHKIFLYLCENGLKGVAVGDVNQAIYGFDKRFPRYLIELIGNSNYTHFELSKNHRCHPSIADYSLSLYGATREIIEDKRVIKVNIEGSEINIAKKIDEKLSSIKEKYNVKENNKIAILCRGNGNIALLDKLIKTDHKIFSDTKLDKDNSKWGRLFRELLIAYFDKDVYAVDYVENLFDKEYENEKYQKALVLCNNIFMYIFAKEKELDDLLKTFVEFATLVYPKDKNPNSVEILKSILCDSELLHSYMPAQNNEINIMTLHKSKGLEFNIVFHMDMYRYVISDDYGEPEEIQQLLNLHYVGLTRAIDACYIMNGTKRYRSKKGDFYDALPSNFLYKKGLLERRKEERW